MVISIFAMTVISQLKLSFWIALLQNTAKVYSNECNMQIARISFAGKTRMFTSVARDASCSRGWVRVVVQTIFAFITVTSFILIVMMAMQNNSLNPIIRPTPMSSRCHINACQVICNEAPYFGLHENEIIFAVVAAEASCERISLILNNPNFINYVLPANWLVDMRAGHLHELSIHGGNLMHIAPGAFTGHFAGSIHTLILKNITIENICDNSFIGLFNLENLYIKNSIIIRIEDEALRPVDGTLQSITVTGSNHWNPVNVTGTTDFSSLTIVDLSFNDFGDILDSSSFAGLGRCKVLYLNSCRITALGPGTFDHLLNIDIIYLNDNLLVTIPSGLFNNIMSVIPKPRINLQDNLWQCDCSSEDLRFLITNKFLYVEPMCHEPEHLQNETFTAFENYCNTFVSKNFITNKKVCNSTSVQLKGNVYINGTCHGDGMPSLNTSIRVFSPVLNQKCPTQTINNINVVKFISKMASEETTTENEWLKLKFFLQTDTYSVVKMDSLASHGYGLLWYQSTCPDEIYCLNILPEYLIVYNIDLSAKYTFCPIEIKSSVVKVGDCIHYDTAKFKIHFRRNTVQIILYLSTGLICLIFGALCVYGLIRKNPSLLKGSKRILFVKHKAVDALVLPPKIPLRNSLINVTPPKDDATKIFIVSNDKHHLSKFSTLKSVKSNNSSSPSYISALQPTDDQLAEWRIRHHFDNNSTLSSASDISHFSWLYNGDSLYYSLESDSDKT